MQDLHVTFLQTSQFWEDTERNLVHFGRLLDRVATPTDLVLLPEMFNTGFTINTELCAEPTDGPSVAFLRERAARLEATVMATVLIREGDSYFNRLFCISPDGKTKTYDKRHLFRLAEEFRILKGGDKKLIVNIKGWNILPIICYDLRFPVWIKNTWDNGAYEYDLLVCLANWPQVRSHAWKTMLACRAMENQVCAVGVNRVGDDGHSIFHSGDSMALDARGQVLASTDPGKEDILTATFSASELRLFRESFTVGADWDQFTIH
jgi:omega-amidase